MDRDRASRFVTMRPKNLKQQQALKASTENHDTGLLHKPGKTFGKDLTLGIVNEKNANNPKPRICLADIGNHTKAGQEKEQEKRKAAAADPPMKHGFKKGDIVRLIKIDKAKIDKAKATTTAINNIPTKPNQDVPKGIFNFKKNNNIPPPITIPSTSVSTSTSKRAIDGEVSPPAPPKTPVNKNEEILADELSNAFSNQRFEIFNVDGIENDYLKVSDYAEDIYEYLFKLEKNKIILPSNYLAGRLINSKMRSVLIDWLVEVHFQFNYTNETLFLAIRLLDTFIYKYREANRIQLQLIGVTCLYLAAKYEEICTPAMSDFSSLSDNAFTKEDVRKMEEKILKVLEFDFSYPLPSLFLRRYSHISSIFNPIVRREPFHIYTLAKYIMELTLMNYSIANIIPSKIAAASILLSLMIFIKGSTVKILWNATMQHYSKCSLEEVIRTALLVGDIFLSHLDEKEPPKLAAIINKYGRSRNYKISKLEEINPKNWKNRVYSELGKLSPL